ncbi:DNA mismatch repair endonuclease MutL [Opitutaceae bacterium EW11]|nr:DNA mismatch repair endonuclease MutL [Opitutaceae bacterium EW11]
MPRIHVLPDRVANQIAAGEVIERPAAVVKELVENALDAGATRIEVEFAHGGRSLMRVEDNGCGMSRDDAGLSLQRHATSKIAVADDLNRLASFGFRGEALPSIASVSRFLLQTRETGAEVGTEILISGGKPVHVRDCGRPVGTRIEVSQLFNSVPARRKFLKSDTTEAAHIIHCVRLYALAFPEVGFTLIEDGRTVFRSPQNTRLAERVMAIFGRQTAEGLIPLEAEEQGMRVSGLIGAPGQGRATRHEMITFINQRPVDSRTLNYALLESYHESLPKGRYPVAFVFFQIPPAEVDVNVHPAKREVRFRSEPAVRSFVIRTVLARLREVSGSVAGAGLVTVAPTAPPAAASMSSAPALVAPALPVSANPIPSASPTAPMPALGSPPATDAQRTWPGPVVTIHPASTAVPPVPIQPQPPSPADTARKWRFLGLVHRHYALFETPGGLGLLDRRAAQERIVYEELKSTFGGDSRRSQRLLLPVPLELDSIATALLIDATPFLEKQGFEIVEFGRNFFRVEAVPDWVQPSETEPWVRDLLGLLREGQLHLKDLDVAREEFARFASARSVRLPEAVSEAEIHAVVAQLFRTQTPLTSPGGRPTYVELSHGDLARRFGR